MNLIKFFFRGSRSMMLCTVLAALLSGACNAGLIAMVNSALSHGGREIPVRLIWAFVALAAGRLLTNCLAQMMPSAGRSRSAALQSAKGFAHSQRFRS